MIRWVLAILAVVLYNGWLAWPLNGSPDALTGYVSELAAADQPFSWFFRGADLAAAVVFAVIGMLGWRGWRRWLGRGARRVATAVLTVSLGTVLDVIFNLPCSQSRDAACAAASRQQVHLHEVASTLVGVGQLAVIVLVVWVLVVREGWTRRVWVIAVLAVVVAALMLAVVAAPYVWPGMQGVVQIVQIVLCSLWLGYLALRLSPSRVA